MKRLMPGVLSVAAAFVPMGARPLRQTCASAQTTAVDEPWFADAKQTVVVDGPDLLALVRHPLDPEI